MGMPKNSGLRDRLKIFMGWSSNTPLIISNQLIILVKIIIIVDLGGLRGLNRLKRSVISSRCFRLYLSKGR